MSDARGSEGASRGGVAHRHAGFPGRDHDAARKTISLDTGGKRYELRTDISLPTVVVRPRGWHLPEHILAIAGKPAVGALVDFGLHFFHNAGYLPNVARARSTTCRSWRATSRRGCGTTSSPTPSGRWHPGWHRPRHGPDLRAGRLGRGVPRLPYAARLRAHPLIWQEVLDLESTRGRRLNA